MAGLMTMTAAGSAVMAGETTTEAPAEGAFVLEYPEDMQALGYTEPLVLDEAPERVVSLSAAPVLALYELGVNLVGIPGSRVVTWPEDLQEKTETVSFSVMSPDDFDYESVVDLEPDLVFLAYNGADTAGKTLESLGIPVYYIYAGHMVPYESIVMQTEVLVDAFSTDEKSREAGEAILQRFDDVEANLEAAKEVFEGKSVMVLQSAADAHYIQTKGGTLGSMADMIGFTNVYENETSSMTQLDFEQALDYDPDVVLCVGGGSAEDQKALMEAAFAENEAYWNSIDAIAEGNVIYLPAAYVSTAGINVVDTINDLIVTLADFYQVDIELTGIGEEESEAEESAEESADETAEESTEEETKE